MKYKMTWIENGSPRSSFFNDERIALEYFEDYRKDTKIKKIKLYAGKTLLKDSSRTTKKKKKNCKSC